ncbi:MAG: restriction endonuclease subunit S [Candidatus Phytoplasma sp. TWB_XP]
MNKIFQQQLRFKNIKSKTRKEKLGSLVEIKYGYGKNKPKTDFSGKYYIMGGGIKYLPDKSNEYNTPANIITISRSGSCRFVFYHQNPFWSMSFCFVLENTKSIINYKYLYHYLKHYQKRY